MLQPEKLENVKREMKRYNLSLLGLCEVRWKNQTDFWSDEIRVICSGGKVSSRGVGILLDKDIGKCVIKTVFHSDRLMLIRLKAKPVDMVVVVYICLHLTILTKK